jgi:hypothetical protein
MTSPRYVVVNLVLVMVVLTACSNVRESLGLGRSAPDEFAVADRPPLSIPPDFGLRPPQPGLPRPQEIDQSKRANDIVFGGGVSASPPADTSEVSDSEKSVADSNQCSEG